MQKMRIDWKQFRNNLLTWLICFILLVAMAAVGMYLVDKIGGMNTTLITIGTGAVLSSLIASIKTEHEPGDIEEP